jgi:hypothetical protein
MDNNKKTGRDRVHRAARKESCNVEATAARVRIAAAIGRAALCGLLPLRFAERLIRRVRKSA